MTTQRVALQDDTSLDLKQLTSTNSDKQLLQTTKQVSSDAKPDSKNAAGKGFPNLANSNKTKR